jgi:endonuclease-8
MPEGHSVFINARDHQRLFAGHRVQVSSPQRRFDASKVDGHKLKRVWALGKHLFYEFGKDLTIHIHLGRLGKFREQTLKRGAEPNKPTPATRMRMRSANHVIDMSGPTACEVLTDAEVTAIRDRIGPDLLDAKSKAKDVWQRVKNRATPIGTLLMDQSLLSGLGNIFRAEVLYLRQIHPSTPTRDLGPQKFAALWREAVKQLKVAVKVGKIVTVPLKSLKKPVDELTRDERFYVYRRTECGGCGAPVKKVTLGGRACFYCSMEQREE